jgi:hypothetical protein
MRNLSEAGNNCDPRELFPSIHRRQSPPRGRHRVNTPETRGNRYVERQPEDGIAVAHRAGIMRHYIDSIQSEPTPVVPLVRWIFERPGNAITCEVDMTETHTCNVSVIPHWNSASAFVEHFDGPVQAMEHHAEVAQELRNAGWVVTRHLRSRQRSL